MNENSDSQKQYSGMPDSKIPITQFALALNSFCVYSPIELIFGVELDNLVS